MRAAGFAGLAAVAVGTALLFSIFSAKAQSPDQMCQAILDAQKRQFCFDKIKSMHIPPVAQSPVVPQTSQLMQHDITPIESNQLTRQNDDGPPWGNIILVLAVIGLAVGFLTKGKKFRPSSVLAILAIAGVAWIIVSGNEAANKEHEAEQEYLREHPLTAEQVAANKHFTTCYEYRHMPSSVWSDDQRNMRLIGEGCYPDDRDDPRSLDATYPWNASAPHPWRDQK